MPHAKSTGDLRDARGFYGMTVGIRTRTKCVSELMEYPFSNSIAFCVKESFSHTQDPRLRCPCFCHTILLAGSLFWKFLLTSALLFPVLGNVGG